MVLTIRSFLIDQNEEKLREVLQFCNACGAICTTKKGAIPALPTTADAMELISKGSN
jgi:fructokinase